MDIMRGELYFVELGPTRGKELDNKRRPVLVLSSNDINRVPLVVTVVPGTTKDPTKPVRRNEVVVKPTETNGLTNPTAFLCFQLKALDHSRFENSPIGVITANDLESVPKACGAGFQPAGLRVFRPPGRLKTGPTSFWNRLLERIEDTVRLCLGLL